MVAFPNYILVNPTPAKMKWHKLTRLQINGALILFVILQSCVDYRTPSRTVHEESMDTYIERLIHQNVSACIDPGRSYQNVVVHRGGTVAQINVPNFRFYTASIMAGSGGLPSSEEFHDRIYLIDPSATDTTAAAIIGEGWIQGICGVRVEPYLPMAARAVTFRTKYPGMQVLVMEGTDDEYYVLQSAFGEEIYLECTPECREVRTHDAFIKAVALATIQ